MAEPALELEQLAALHTELAALIRAGVPLEAGLRAFSRDAPGRLSAAAQRLSERLARGEDFEAALAAEGFPEAYRAVVIAGQSAGRLPAALEQLTAVIARVNDLRQTLAVAMIYPTVVTSFCYGLFVAYVVWAAPQFYATFVAFETPWADALAPWAALGSSAWLWAPIVPVLVLAAYWLWRRTARNWSMVFLFPGARRLTELTQLAIASEILALLVRENVPLAKATSLAVRGSENRRLIAAGDALAADLSAGLSLEAALDRRSDWPPLWGWLARVGSRQGTLAQSLEHAAAIYRQRAWRQADWVGRVMPSFFVLAFGGAATLVMVVAVFWPLTQILRGMNIEH